MEDLFRFVVVRQPDKPSETQAVSLENAGSPVQSALLQASQAPNPIQSIANSASQILAGGAVPRAATELRLGVRSLAFSKALAEEKPPLNKEVVARRVAEHFGANSAEVVRSEDFKKDKARVQDAIVAIRAARQEAKYPIADFVSIARSMAVIEQAAQGAEPEALTQLATATLVLPGAIFPVTGPQAARARAPTSTPPVAPDPLKRVARLDRAIADVAAARTAVATAPKSVVTQQAPKSAGFLARVIPAGVRKFFAAGPGLPASQPAGPDAPRLTAAALAALSQETRTELRGLALDTGNAGFEVVHMTLMSTRDRVAKQFGGLAGTDVVPVGVKFIAAVPLHPAGPAGPEPPDDEAPPAHLPSTPSRLQGIGWADLKVVRQHLIRYEANEIAHVENVLTSETRKRIVKHTSTTETTTLDETETTTEQQRDLQTTDRFELKREVAEVTKEDSSLKTGLTVSAHYGAILDVNASVGYQLDKSKEESVKIASSYGKDVTSRAASKVTERVLTRRTRKIVDTLAEKDFHSFENTAGPDVVGIYQWLDKVYEAQVFNYGSRFLFDLTVPEPGAFLLDAMMNPTSEGEVLLRPLPFTLRPQDVSELPGALIPDENDQPTETPADFRFYVNRYRATGVVPPPHEELILSQSCSSKAESTAGADKPPPPQPAKELVVSIPETHRAVEALVRAVMSSADDKAALTAIVGGQTFSFDKSNNGVWMPFLPVERVTTQLAVAVIATGVDYALTVQVRCERTPRAMDAWRLSTHAALLAASIQIQTDYENRLEAARLRQSGATQWGSNPEHNRSLERAELKKSCISVVTQQHFGWIGAVEESAPPVPHRYPQVDLSRSDSRGSYTRFFEQAFEWEHMVYFLYPYFWGRKSRWYERVLLDDNDGLFGEFLRAGAARVVLAVRPGFEQAVAHYLESGELWDGSEFIDTKSPLFVPITQEIKAAADAADKPPQPEGTPWEVRIPTTLVKLRNPPDLPVWIKEINATTQEITWWPARWDKTANAYRKDPAGQ